MWRYLSILLFLGVVVDYSGGDSCDKRDRRLKRSRMMWKGDLGDLESFPGGVVPDAPAGVVPERQKIHRRVRRFLSFPTGSILSVTPTLTIPWVNEINGYKTSDQVYKFPIDLRLPNASLKFIDKSPQMHYGYGQSNMYSKYDNFYDDGYDNFIDDGYESSYQGYDDHYFNDPHYYWNRKKRRALDDQRLQGFAFLEQLLNNLGLDGRECLLRIVCEIGKDPLDDLGLTGEIISLFFSAGYGSRIEELRDYITAEESGRSEGDCEALYDRCPYDLVSLGESALSYLHLGLAHVGDLNANTLLSQ